jgi:hypothetical protein
MNSMAAAFSRVMPASVSRRVAAMVSNRTN